MSLVEFFMREVEPEQIPRGGPMSIRPVVVDANALISDVYYAAAHHGHSALLDAADLGVARLFAPLHIYAKVYAGLPELAYGPRLGLLVEAHRLWEMEYLPLIRFVNVDGIATDDARVIATALRDTEDEPVAKLAALLGPCHLMSQDKDLITLGGSAGTDWRPVAVAGRDAMVPTQAVVAGSIPYTVVHAGLSSTVGFLKARPEWRAPVALVFLLILGFIGYKIITADRTNWKESLGNFIADTAERARPYIERYQHAKATLREATIIPANELDPLNRVAHILSTAPRPLLMTEISRVLAARAGAVRLTPQQVGAVLRAHPCFRRNLDGRWKLGYIAAPLRPQPASVTVLDL
jgi:hypothetical protein